MKNRVACCYLTHNHPEVMDEVLNHICGPYGEKGIDIYVYDSSPSGETEEIVKGYISEDLCDLHYVPVQFIKGIRGGDEKYIYVIKGNGLKGHYDYIWPTKDRCWFEGETLDRICDSFDGNYDVIFAVDERDRFELIGRPLIDVYTDPVEFFGDYGALTTNWECLIRRADTMLDPIDWSLYSSKHNVCKDNNFNQTVSTFVRLAELENSRIRVIRSNPDDKRYSNKAKPLWISALMETWIDRWIPTIYSLPDIYNGYKLNVIKTQLGHVSLFGSNDSLINMRDMGILTPERVKILSSMWEMISRIPKENLDKIISYDEKTLFDVLYEDFIRSFKTGDYEKGYYLFIQNQWMRERFQMDKYRILALSYYIYMMDLRRGGYSLLFDRVRDVNELFDNFEKYSRG